MKTEDIANINEKPEALTGSFTKTFLVISAVFLVICAGIYITVTLMENSGFAEIIPADAAAVHTETLININTADAETLCSLPGIGEVTAAAIIEFREKYGSFSSTDELLEIKGIGESKYAAVKDMITV